eukprot:scpid12708/ scgid22251/ 
MHHCSCYTVPLCIVNRNRTKTASTKYYTLGPGTPYRYQKPVRKIMEETRWQSVYPQYYTLAPQHTELRSRGSEYSQGYRGNTDALTISVAMVIVVLRIRWRVMGGEKLQITDSSINRVAVAAAPSS